MPESSADFLKLNKTDFGRAKSLRRMKDFNVAFDRSFSLVAYIANRHLIDHMLRVSRLLTNGDFEVMVIWGVLAHQNIAHLMPPGTVPAAVLTEKGRLRDESTELKPLKLRDLALITGIPRETVRRKLEQLALNRFARRVQGGWVLSTERAEPELRDFTRDTVVRLAAACDEMLEVLQSVDGGVPSANDAQVGPGTTSPPT